MSTRTLATLFAAGLLLAACSSTPPPPDWQVSSQGSLKLAITAYFAGEPKAAEVEFTRVRSEVASTGRLDLAARAELVRCAAQVAALEFGPCEGYQKLAADAAAPERAYAAFLGGQWGGVDAALLPAHYRPLLTGTPGVDALRAVPDPLARLVAAAVLLRKGLLSPEGMRLAGDTASDQGWRRAVLAWLGAQAELADKAGNAAEAQRLRRRMALASGQPLP